MLLTICSRSLDNKYCTSPQIKSQGHNPNLTDKITFYVMHCCHRVQNGIDVDTHDGVLWSKLAKLCTLCMKPHKCKCKLTISQSLFWLHRIIYSTAQKLLCKTKNNYRVGSNCKPMKIHPDLFANTLAYKYIHSMADVASLLDHKI